MGFDLGDEAIADQSGSFKNWEFFELYLELALVGTLFGIGSLAILHYGLKYRVSRVYSFLAIALLRTDWAFDNLSFVLAVATWVAYLFVPAASFFAWGLVAAITLDPSIVGVTVIFLSISLMAGVYGFGLWRANKWRLTYPSGIAVAVSVTMLVGYMLAVITATEPFSYMGFSAVFLAINVIPMIIILYLNMPGTFVHFESFVENAISGSQSEFETAGREKIPCCFGACGPLISRNHVRSMALYLIAQGTLVAYAILVHRYIDDDTVKYVGFVNWGALFVVDVVLYLYYMAGFFDSPLSASFFFIAVRGIIIAFGARYWFIAHSVVFVLVALFLGISWVKDHYPARKTSGASIVAHESLAKVVLSNLPTPGYLSLELPQGEDVHSSEFDESELEKGGLVAPTTQSGDDDYTDYYDDEYEGDDEYDDDDDDEYDDDEYEEEQESAYSASATASATGSTAGSATTDGYTYDNVETYTEEDLSGYSGYGKTRVACCTLPSFSSIVLTRPFMMLVMSAAFLAELLVVEEKREATVDMDFLSKRRRQYLFGIGAFVMSLVLPLAFFTYRLYQRAKFHLTAKVCLAAFVTEFVIVGNGVFFYFTADSIVILGFHIFFPLIVLFACATMIQWIRNDYFFFVHGKTRDNAKPEDYVCNLVLLPDLGMIAGTAGTILMIFGLSLTVALGLDAQITGWTIGTVIFVPLCTYISIKEWFNTFTFSWTNVISVVAQLVVLFGYALGVFLTTLDAEVDERSLALLFTVLVYPTLVLLVVGIWKWWDDKWEFKFSTPAGKFITFSMVASFVLMVSFGVVVMLVYKPFWAGLGVLVVVGIFYSLVWVSISFVRNGFYLTTPYRLAILFVLCGAIAMGLGVGFVESGILGFSISWGSLFVLLTLVAVQDWFNAQTQPRQFSKFIFPVYMMETENDRLVSANQGLYCAYGALIVASLWGVALSLFFPPPWVGLLVTAGAITLFVLLTVHLLWDPPATFGAQLRYIDSSVLEKARKQALGSELNRPDPSVKAIHGGSTADSYSGGYYDDEDEESSSAAASTRYGSGSDEYDYSEEQEEEEEGKGKSSSYSYEEVTITSDHHGRFLRPDGTGATSAQVLEERAEFEANELESRDSYIELLRYDVGINNAFKAEQRFVAHLQQLVLSLASYKRAKEEAIISAMLKETVEYNNPEFPLKESDIELWDRKDWRLFQKRLTQYLRKQKLLEKRNESRRQEDANAQAKRDAARRKLQKELEKKRRKAKEEGEGGSDESEVGGVSAAGLSFNPRDAPVIGPDPAKIIKKAEKKGVQWSDEEFEANDEALFRGEAAVSGKVEGWARPEEVFETRNGNAPGESDMMVFKDPIEPRDIGQGALGDCWLLSAFAIVAQYPERVRDIFETDEVNDAGAYGVKLWAGGKWVRVMVDSKLPVDGKGRLAYARTGRGDGSELWVSLLEKAFAKQYGSYGALNGGLVHMGLVDLTGGQAETIAFRDEETTAEIQSGRLWKKLLGYQKAKYLMGCGSNAGKDTATSKKGIVQGHAYAILGLYEESSHRLLKIYNPWSTGEWKGDWSDASDMWTRRLRAKLDFREADDGVFFMSFEDFVREFRNLYICRIFPETWSATGLASAWSGASAGGCSNFDTCKNNPQFLLEISVPTQTFITVAKDMLNASDVEHIAFFVFVSKDGGASKIDPQYARAGDRVGSSGKYSPLREVSAELKLKPGKYVIVPTTFKAGQEGEFVVAVNSDRPVKISEIGGAGPSSAAPAESGYEYEE